MSYVDLEFLEVQPNQCTRAIDCLVLFLFPLSLVMNRYDCNESIQELDKSHTTIGQLDMDIFPGRVPDPTCPPHGRI
jgi:hypothetical protein